MQCIDKDLLLCTTSGANLLTPCGKKLHRTAFCPAPDPRRWCGISAPLQVLTPLRSAAMPRLLDRLEQMPDYSIFRGYIIVSFHMMFTRVSAPRKLSAFFAFRTSTEYQWSVWFLFQCVSQQYSLANEIEAANAYTVFAPSNNAIENYLKDKKSATLVCITHKACPNSSVFPLF